MPGSESATAGSMSVLERRWTSIHRLSAFINSLHRRVESARNLRHLNVHPIDVVSFAYWPNAVRRRGAAGDVEGDGRRSEMRLVANIQRLVLSAGSYLDVVAIDRFTADFEVRYWRQPGAPPNRPFQPDRFHASACSHRSPWCITLAPVSIREIPIKLRVIRRD